MSLIKVQINLKKLQIESDYMCFPKKTSNCISTTIPDGVVIARESGPHLEEGGPCDADVLHRQWTWPNENTEKGGGLDLLHLTLMKMIAPQVLSDKRKDVSLTAGR